MYVLCGVFISYLLMQVLSRSGKAEILTNPHRPYGSNKVSLQEIKRIREAGGWVCFPVIVFVYFLLSAVNFWFCYAKPNTVSSSNTYCIWFLQIVNGRICGDIAVSRAFGDLRFKTKKKEFSSFNYAFLSRKWILSVNVMHLLYVSHDNVYLLIVFSSIHVNRMLKKGVEEGRWSEKFVSR